MGASHICWRPKRGSSFVDYHKLILELQMQEGQEQVVDLALQPDQDLLADAEADERRVCRREEGRG